MNTTATSILFASAADNQSCTAPVLSSSASPSLNPVAAEGSRTHTLAGRSAAISSRPLSATFSLECKESIDLQFASAPDRDFAQAPAVAQEAASLPAGIGARSEDKEEPRTRKWSVFSAFVEVGHSPHVSPAVLYLAEAYPAI